MRACGSSRASSITSCGTVVSSSRGISVPFSRRARRARVPRRTPSPVVIRESVPRARAARDAPRRHRNRNVHVHVPPLPTSGNMRERRSAAEHDRPARAFSLHRRAIGREKSPRLRQSGCVIVAGRRQARASPVAERERERGERVAADAFGPRGATRSSPTHRADCGRSAMSPSASTRFLKRVEQPRLLRAIGERAQLNARRAESHVRSSSTRVRSSMPLEYFSFIAADRTTLRAAQWRESVRRQQRALGP